MKFEDSNVFGNITNIDKGKINFCCEYFENIYDIYVKETDKWKVGNNQEFYVRDFMTPKGLILLGIKDEEEWYQLLDDLIEWEKNGKGKMEEYLIKTYHVDPKEFEDANEEEMG